jgi:hypothetical protein
MTVREIVVGDERFQVTGGGYAPHGKFLRDQPQGASPRVNDDVIGTRPALRTRNGAAFYGELNRLQ